jgi:hypothetical protein
MTVRDGDDRTVNLTVGFPSSQQPTVPVWSADLTVINQILGHRRKRAQMSFSTPFPYAPLPRLRRGATSTLERATGRRR